MIYDAELHNTRHIQSLRLNTLIRLRWLAVVGQSMATLVVAFYFEFPVPVLPCFILIGAAAFLNTYLGYTYPATHRLLPRDAAWILIFDVLQLGGLLFLTGGLTNPFSVLLAVPVVISATTLPRSWTELLGMLVVGIATALAFFHLPLPWFPGTELRMPFIYIAGVWVAVVSSIAFSGVYAYRVAEEARLLANALTATELVLQREQHISALDGLAAAAAHELGTPLATIALVSREMEKALGDNPDLKDDVALLRSQSERCREILKQLTSLSTESGDHLVRMTFTALIEETVEPHRDFGIRIEMEQGECEGREPVVRRNPGVHYGLGNLVENAVDFARETVMLRWWWNERQVGLTITDDGKGFPPEILERIGDPYVTKRASGHGGGLGLGLFIAKTLLERSGATIVFANSTEEGKGARVDISWSREAFFMSHGGLPWSSGAESNPHSTEMDGKASEI